MGCYFEIHPRQAYYIAFVLCRSFLNGHRLRMYQTDLLNLAEHGKG